MFYLVLIADNLMAWITNAAADQLAKATPKRLRYTILHTAGRLASRTARARLNL